MSNKQLELKNNSDIVNNNIYLKLILLIKLVLSSTFLKNIFISKYNEPILINTVQKGKSTIMKVLKDQKSYM